MERVSEYGIVAIATEQRVRSIHMWYEGDGDGDQERSDDALLTPAVRDLDEHSGTPLTPIETTQTLENNVDKAEGV